MRSTKRIVLGAIFAALGLVAGGFAPADAGTCGTSASCTFDLTVSNVPQLTPIDVRVIWDNTGGTTVFSVQWISGGPGTPGFISDFGFNLLATVNNVTYNGNNVTSLWTLNGSGVQDGFGNFASTETNGPTAAADREGILHPILFTLSTKITSIPNTTTGTEFVAHVGGYASGCSGWVGEAGSTPGQTSTPSCGVAAAEPGTVGALAFVGFSLVSAGAFLRRRWFRHEA